MLDVGGPPAAKKRFRSVAFDDKEKDEGEDDDDESRPQRPGTDTGPAAGELTVVANVVGGSAAPPAAQSTFSCEGVVVVNPRLVSRLLLRTHAVVLDSQLVIWLPLRMYAVVL